MSMREKLLVAVLAWHAGALWGATPAAPAAAVGMLEEPCPPAYVMPEGLRAVLRDLFIEPRMPGAADFSRLANTAGFAEMERSNRERAASDWPGLCRYRAANTAMAPGAARVVFIGDSITENWFMADPGFFSGPIVNRGIGAQTSAQMLLRFRADVVALRPAVVHILAGTNDVAGNNGPVRPRDFQNNIESMAEIALANGIRVVIGSIPPAAAFSWQPAMRPAPRIAALNAWLRDYATRKGLVYVDYHAALRGPDGELRTALGNDGVHPNRDGYAVMRRLAEQALAD